MQKLIFHSNIQSQEYQILFGAVDSHNSCNETDRYKKFFVIADRNTILYANTLPFDNKLIEIPVGEQGKSLFTVTQVYKSLEEADATRRSTLLIGVGGGAICDLTGFVAMTYMRGISYALYPTTLVAMADAAVGSKVAVNGPSGSKNLIGGYWSPTYVQIDLKVLETLKERVYLSAFGEIIKIACIAGDNGALINYLEENFKELSTRSCFALKYVLEQVISIKIKLVEDDLFEKNLDRLLNLGHALGHAIEVSSNYELLHGESIAIGLAESIRTGIRRGICSPEYAKRIIQLLELFKLPVQIPKWLPDDKLLHELKKITCVRDGNLREVIPVSPGEASIKHDIQIETLINNKIE